MTQVPANTVQLDALFDHMEDVLVRGFHGHGDVVSLGEIQPLMETARALLMVWRGVEPLWPRGMPEIAR